MDTAGGLNAAAALAAGEYLAFVDEGSTLSPFALYYVAEALQSGLFDLCYTDEDATDADGRLGSPVFKPDWSPDLLTSCMYMGQLLTVRRERFAEAGGLRSEYEGSHLHDLALAADRRAGARPQDPAGAISLRDGPGGCQGCAASRRGSDSKKRRNPARVHSRTRPGDLSRSPARVARRYHRDYLLQIRGIGWKVPGCAARDSGKGSIARDRSCA